MKQLSNIFEGIFDDDIEIAASPIEIVDMANDGMQRCFSDIAERYNDLYKIYILSIIAKPFREKTSELMGKQSPNNQTRSFIDAMKDLEFAFDTNDTNIKREKVLDKMKTLNKTYPVVVEIDKLGLKTFKHWEKIVVNHGLQGPDISEFYVTKRNFELVSQDEFVRFADEINKKFKKICTATVEEHCVEVNWKV
jgi:hypothetical protein